ncbi:hypothetical protein AACH06_29300 [Ideonella sp. DXS29W]|uniref:Uncharacterized protein n=1 Tax=Ideonella lacteola TaxID=2984193 RepID=A0ABU9BY68_9BURK
MSEVEKVKCETHGWQEESFVCQHIAGTLLSGVSVGFHWSAGSVAKHPDAWCSVCEEARVQAGGEWTSEVEEQLNIKLLCSACYEHAKSIWSNGRKVTQ